MSFEISSNDYTCHIVHWWSSTKKGDNAQSSSYAYKLGYLEKKNNNKRILKILQIELPIKDLALSNLKTFYTK